MPAGNAGDLDELDRIARRPRGGRERARAPDRHRRVLGAVDEEDGGADRHLADRIDRVVALGEPIGRAAHDRMDGAVAVAGVGLGHRRDAGLGDDAPEADPLGWARAEPAWAGGPQRELTARRVSDDHRPFEVHPWARLGQELHPRGQVGERGRPPSPASAPLADLAVLDVPHTPAAAQEVGGEAAHEPFAVPGLPRAAVDEHRHPMGTAAPR